MKQQQVQMTLTHQDGGYGEVPSPAPLVTARRKQEAQRREIRTSRRETLASHSGYLHAGSRAPTPATSWHRPSPSQPRAPWWAGPGYPNRRAVEVGLAQAGQWRVMGGARFASADRLVLNLALESVKNLGVGIQ